MRDLKPFMFTLLSAAFVMGTSGCAIQDKVTLNVSAGVGLTDALIEINCLYMEINSNIQILNNFAAAGDLQTQIENGSPTDVFISAAAAQMNSLEEKELIIAETRRDILQNELVLIAPMESKLALAGFADLLLDEVELIAMGDPQFVPAGYYGLQTLELLNISIIELQPKLILAANVRQVLSYVESNNVDAGIVYATDAASSNLVQLIATAPAAINNTIVYPAAIVTASQNFAAALDYLDYLTSADAEDIFIKHGFTIINQ
ncbi:MAG: molybdate ABC transporter substrate-binding protein [Dethiobacteria bacterium]|nr:molybdate ABC transporter substrate-binding protein [Dethiobacteria bacterium]